MSFSWVPPVTVTLTVDANLYVPTTPAVNVQAAQQVGIARAGDNQTVVAGPSE